MLLLYGTTGGHDWQNTDGANFVDMLLEEDPLTAVIRAGMSSVLFLRGDVSAHIGDNDDYAKEFSVLAHNSLHLGSIILGEPIGCICICVRSCPTYRSKV